MRKVPKMVEKQLMVETLSELQIWIEGKFALITQAQVTAHDDLTNVRKTVHDLAGHMTVLTMLNLPDKLSKLEAADKTHEANIEKFITDAAERRGALAVLKVVYAALGATIGVLITILLQFYRS
jgi:hypothetical protein